MYDFFTFRSDSSRMSSSGSKCVNVSLQQNHKHEDFCAKNSLENKMWIIIKHCGVQLLNIHRQYYGTTYLLSVFPVDVVTRRPRQQQQNLLLMNLHLLANPGDSLLLQQTLDRVLRWLCPSLRIFHVSERASPYRSYTPLCPVAGRSGEVYFYIMHLAIEAFTNW